MALNGLYVEGLVKCEEGIPELDKNDKPIYKLSDSILVFRGTNNPISDPIGFIVDAISDFDPRGVGFSQYLALRNDPKNQLNSTVLTSLDAI